MLNSINSIKHFTYTNIHIFYIYNNITSQFTLTQKSNIKRYIKIFLCNTIYFRRYILFIITIRLILIIWGIIIP